MGRRVHNHLQCGKRVQDHKTSPIQLHRDSRFIHWLLDRCILRASATALNLRASGRNLKGQQLTPSCCISKAQKNKFSIGPSKAGWLMQETASVLRVPLWGRAFPAVSLSCAPPCSSCRPQHLLNLPRGPAHKVRSCRCHHPYLPIQGFQTKEKGWSHHGD